MNTLRSSSYSSWSEWLLVKSILIDASPAEQAQQLPQCASIVSMWRARGAIPHSIDMSCLLVELLSSDTALSSPQACSSPRFSDQELSQLYSLAIIRAVNGITEPSQQGYFARSVLSIAENLGLPGWIVELRHDATHGSTLPSLSVLRAAATYLLGWYTDNYWTPQAQELSVVTMQCLQPFQKLGSGLAPTFLSDFLAPLFTSSCLNCAQTPPSSSSSGSPIPVVAATSPSSSTLRDCLHDWRTRLSALSSGVYQDALYSIAARLAHEALHIAQMPPSDTHTASGRLSTLLICMQEIDSLMADSGDCRKNARFLPALWQCWQSVTPCSLPLAEHCPAISEIDKQLRRWAADVTPIPPADKPHPKVKQTEGPRVGAVIESAGEGANKKRALDEMEGWLLQLSQKAPKCDPVTSKKTTKLREDGGGEDEKDSPVSAPSYHISFADLSRKGLVGAPKLCTNYPIWPAGLLPGEFEPVALLSLRERAEDSVGVCPSIQANTR